MHVLWNVIRFFIFSFFLYGTAYGIGFLVIKDSIAYIIYIFDNVKDIKIIGESADFFDFCLKGEHNFKKKFGEYESKFLDPLNDFFSNFDSFDVTDIIKNSEKTLCGSDQTGLTLDQCNFLYKKAISTGGLFGLFDCGFVDIDLQHLYRTLYDASVESRILAALSLCSSFFGAIAVYFFLLVLHHYNNELFFDTGKSIFTGFDGFGGGYKKKIHDKDPAYKKRKLRAEIELTSKNDEASGYKDINKNQEDE